MSWKLKRIRQCDKCPWKVSTNPHDIPNAYTEDLHAFLAATIAVPASLNGNGHIMTCHEHPVGEEAHSVGWLMKQIGPGNNIPLRLKVRPYENLDHVVLDGLQYECFDDTLAERRPLPAE